MEGVGLGPTLPLELALLHGAVVGEQLEGGAPLLELHLPVQHHRGGHHYEVRTPDAPAHCLACEPLAEDLPSMLMLLGLPPPPQNALLVVPSFHGHSWRVLPVFSYA